MIHLESYQNFGYKNLLIVDVQPTFRRFFTENYLSELKKYCKTFTSVYQIWDNHVDGKNVDTDYLYDKDIDGEIRGDLYVFPNQKDLIEKRYTYKVDAEYFKPILKMETLNQINKLVKENRIKVGDMFPTKKETYIIYVGNNHKWFHIPKKLYELFKDMRGEEISMVGGSDNECLKDIEVAAVAIGVKIKLDHRFIYSASNCPIK